MTGRTRTRRLGAVLGMLLVVLAGCQAMAEWLPPTPVPSPTVTPRPTSTPFRLPPTFTPRPSSTRPVTPAPSPGPTDPVGTGSPHTTPGGLVPSPTSRARATATPRVTPTATAFPGGTRYGFAGLCSQAPAAVVSMPCLYSSGPAVVDGRQVLRYVFENIPYPDTFYVEINGAALTCTTLPDYPTRAYCTGRVPVQTPIQLRLGWTEPDGRPIEVYVDPAVVEAVRQRGFFPLGP